MLNPHRGLENPLDRNGPPTDHVRARIHLLASGGTPAVIATVLMIGALDVVHALGPASLRSFSLSEHALGPHHRVFESAVLLLAAGSLAILAVLVHHGLTRWGSGGSIALMLWSLGLSTVAVFPKYNWAVGPSLSGAIHRCGSVLAFLSLPVAALLLARPWLRHVTCSRFWSTRSRVRRGGGSCPSATWSASSPSSR